MLVATLWLPELGALIHSRDGRGTRVARAREPRHTLEGRVGKIDFFNHAAYTNYAYEQVARSETEHLA